MTQPSEAYTVAQHIHDSFFAANDSLTAEEIAATGVVANFNSGPNHTSSLYIRGEHEGRDAYQSLSRGKDGRFTLSTVFTEPGGEVDVTRITPQSAPEKLDNLVASLYIKALVKIANSRQQQSVCRMSYTMV